MEKVIEFNGKRYYINEFQGKFGKQYTSRICKEIEKVNPSIKNCTSLEIIVHPNWKGFTINERYVTKKTKLFGPIKTQIEIGTKTSEVNIEDQYKNKLNKTKTYGKNTLKREIKINKQDKKIYVIDLKEIRNLQKKAFVEKYGSNSSQNKKEKTQDYNAKLDKFWKRYTGRETQKDYEKRKEQYKNTNLEKCLKELQQISEVLLDF